MFKMRKYLQFAVVKKYPNFIFKVKCPSVFSVLWTYFSPSSPYGFSRSDNVALQRLTVRYYHVYAQFQMVCPLSLASNISLCLLFSASCELRENWNSTIIQWRHTHTHTSVCWLCEPGQWGWPTSRFCSVDCHSRSRQLTKWTPSAHPDAFFWRSRITFGCFL